MPSRPFPLVQTVPTKIGTPEFEQLRSSFLKELADSISEEYYISRSIANNPPKHVTSIPRECGILSAEEVTITENYDATGLAEAIAAKKFTAIVVATAFAKRAAIAAQLTCCLTEWFMEEAVAQAHALDEHLARTGQPVGPLHGVPISIKEHIPVAGHYSSVGYADSRRKDANDAPMVAILRRLGAVFYCKTNGPQSLMHLESDSIRGRVLNPFNTGLSAGGSTGGEAALLALRGSVLGVGTDIGGSVRGPAGFCGIYGFKPTGHTLPMRDYFPGGVMPAELNVICSTGPMCTSLRDLDLFMSLVLGTRPYLEDPSLIPIPWTGLRTRLSRQQPLKIGFMMHDGMIRPQPPVTRALEWARAQLERSGRFEVKDFAPWRTTEAMRNVLLAYWPDGAASVRNHLAATGEPMFPLTEWIIKDAEREYGGPNPDPSPSWAVVHTARHVRDHFRCGFAAHWTQQDVDIVICPVFVGPACAHDTAFYWNYTALWNYLDYPGAVVPTPVRVGAKGDTADAYPEGIEPLGEQCRHIRQLWEEGDFEGAPINMQVVARRHHDNELFSALEEMKGVLQL